MSAIVAVAALFLSDHYGAPVMLFALLLGMAVNFLSQDERCQPGIEFVARQVLRWGVALLGLKITAAQVQAMGWQPVLMVVLVVVLTIGLGIVLARWMGFKTFFGLLSGGGGGHLRGFGCSGDLGGFSAPPSQRPRDLVRGHQCEQFVHGGHGALSDAGALAGSGCAASGFLPWGNHPRCGSGRGGRLQHGASDGRCRHGGQADAGGHARAGDHGGGLADAGGIG
jgi:hypothetical protein